MKHHLELLIISVLVSFNISLAQNYGGWQQVDSMKEARYSHSAIQLVDGRVLIVGGVGASDPKSCEFYDPLLNKWSAAPKTNYVRSRHRLIMLSSGRVLAIGSPIAKACEIFDSALNQWIVTDSLKVGRYLAEHQVVRLQNNRILVIGGYTRDFPVTSEDRTLKLCEIFDETIEKWSIADSMKTRRSYHSATLLKDGRVLVAGGTSSVDPLNSCEIYEPNKNEWSYVKPMNVARKNHTALLLPNGKVLVVAGYSYNNLSPTRSCELYDPIQDKWEIVDSTQVEGSAGAAFILDERNILLVGANGNQNLIWEIYDYINFKSKYVGYVNTRSFSNNKIQLNDGRVLVSGGVTTPDYFLYLPVKSCWIYDKNITHIDEVSDRIDNTFIFQNYPNPFNVGTTIRFFVEKSSEVKITIYNILGEQVKELMNERKEHGYHEIQFLPHNLPSGVYYCRITIEEKGAIKKLLLIK
jgi:hypothetical protein